MAAQKQDSINLLPQKGFEITTTGRVLAWILSTFRVIVILTEIIVMIAFLSRFWLDAQNSDLDDEIELKQALLSASLPFEKEFKLTQKRLKIFSELTTRENLIKSNLETLTKYLPQDLFLNSITYQSGSFQIVGSSPNELSIQQLIVNLNSTNLYSEVEINDIKSDVENPNLLVFTLNIPLKGESEGKEK